MSGRFSRDATLRLVAARWLAGSPYYAGRKQNEIRRSARRQRDRPTRKYHGAIARHHGVDCGTFRIPPLMSKRTIRLRGEEEPSGTADDASI